MKRTLLAVGIAVLVSMMAVPFYGQSDWPCIFYANDTVWIPFFAGSDLRVVWTEFILQTVFVCILAAIIVNIWPRDRKT
jgi:hypothetical protein